MQFTHTQTHKPKKKKEKERGRERGERKRAYLSQERWHEEKGIWVRINKQLVNQYKEGK